MASVAPLRVLVVDDDDDSATTLALLLKHCGHEAVAATSGKAALEQAPLFHPDVCLIDLAMPKVDGLSVARQLRQQAEFADTPLIAVSGYVDPGHRAQATAAGFDDFLAKPFPLFALQETMERAARRLRTSQQKAQIAGLAAEQTWHSNAAMRRELDDFWCQLRRSVASIPVTIEKSGTSRLVTLAERGAAEELRRWLKFQRCRVGPVFESGDEQFAFFVYSRRQEIAELVAQYGKFKVDCASDRAGPRRATSH